MTDHAAEAAASELKAQAFGLLQSQAMEQAAEVLQRAAELDPGDAPTWQLLGLLWNEVGAPDRAYEAATRYVALEPDRAQAYLNRGAIGLDLGRFDDAIADHRRAARLQRTSDTLVWLANAYDRAGRFDEAFAAYAEALEIDPDNPVGYYERALAHRGRRHFAEAVADVDRALALDPEYEAARSLRESLIVEEHQPAGDAEPGEFDPGNPVLLTDRGWKFLLAGDLEAAVADLTRAIELAPDYLQAYTNRGAALRALGRRPEAAADFARTVQLDARYAYGYFNLGAVLSEMGRHEESVASLTEGIEIDATDGDYFQVRGHGYEALGRIADALADYTRAVRLNPESALAHLSRGNMLYDLGRHPTALRDFDKAIALDPEIPLAYVNRAATLEALHRDDDALDDLRHALALAPDLAIVHLKLGALRLRGGDPAEAARHYRRAKELGHPGADGGLAAAERAQAGN